MEKLAAGACGVRRARLIGLVTVLPALQDFFPAHADQFLHELRVFLQQPYDMRTWDGMVQYPSAVAASASASAAHSNDRDNPVVIDDGDGVPPAPAGRRVDTVNLVADDDGAVVAAAPAPARAHSVVDLTRDDSAAAPARGAMGALRIQPAAAAAAAVAGRGDVVVIDDDDLAVTEAEENDLGGAKGYEWQEDMED